MPPLAPASHQNAAFAPENAQNMQKHTPAPAPVHHLPHTMLRLSVIPRTKYLDFPTSLFFTPTHANVLAGRTCQTHSIRVRPNEAHFHTLLATKQYRLKYAFLVHVHAHYFTLQDID